MKINFITSFPKSGNTWVRFIIYDLIYNKNKSLKNSESIKNRIPDLHTFPMKVVNKKILFKFDNNLMNIEKEIFFKTHFPYNILDKSITNKINKVILLIRNPLDILSSLLNYYDVNNVNLKKNDINFFLKNHTLEYFQKLGFGRWEEHISSWKKCGLPVLILTYESMLNDINLNIKKIINFLNLNISEEKIKQTINNTKFENLKNIENIEKNKSIPGFFLDNMTGKKTNFMFRGKSGTSKNCFDLNTQKKLNDEFAFFIKKYKLS